MCEMDENTEGVWSLRRVFTEEPLTMQGVRRASSLMCFCAFFPPKRFEFFHFFAMLRRQPTRLTLTDVDQEEFQQLSEKHEAKVRRKVPATLGKRG